MVDVRAAARMRPVNNDINEWVGLWANSDGASISREALQAYVLAGQGFIVNVGAFSTPIVGGGAGTVLDLDQPEFIISVPSGTAIMPFRVHIQTQSPLLAADSEESEILLAVDRTAKAVDDGTKTAETIYNLRTDNPVASGCVATSAYTADVTDPVLDIELARSVVLGDFQGTPANAMWTKHELLYEPRVIPILVGPCMLVGYWGGTVATSGFAEVQWVELNANHANLFRG